jgi:hypothetical protein
MSAKSLPEFYAGLSDHQRAIAERLRELILSAHPGISEKLNWGVPCFRLNKWFIYLNGLKGDAIDLCFMQGFQLTDEAGLLEGRGRKMVRSIKISSLAGIQTDVLLTLIFEAIDLDLTRLAPAKQ